jgi:hypothetical protein
VVLRVHRRWKFKIVLTWASRPGLLCWYGGREDYLVCMNEPTSEGLRTAHAHCRRVEIPIVMMLRQVGVTTLGETFPLLVLAKDRTRSKGPGKPWYGRKADQLSREAPLWSL